MRSVRGVFAGLGGLLAVVLMLGMMALAGPVRAQAGVNYNESVSELPNSLVDTLEIINTNVLPNYPYILWGDGGVSNGETVGYLVAFYISDVYFPTSPYYEVTDHLTTFGWVSDYTNNTGSLITSYQDTAFDGNITLEGCYALVNNYCTSVLGHSNWTSAQCYVIVEAGDEISGSWIEDNTFIDQSFTITK